jgi:hypothetical protein
MSIPYPGQCRHNADSHDDSCYNAHGQYRGVIVLGISEDEDEAKYQPNEPRRCASRMDTSEMLKY